MGLVPELASTHFLVQRVGFSLASELCLTGDLYEASQIADSGLFNKVVPAEQLLPEAIAMASGIAANPAPSLRMIKRLLTENGTCDDLDLVGRREHEALAAAYETAEHKAAVAAFMANKKH